MKGGGDILCDPPLHPHFFAMIFGWTILLKQSYFSYVDPKNSTLNIGLNHVFTPTRI